MVVNMVLLIIMSGGMYLESVGVKVVLRGGLHGHCMYCWVVDL